MPTFGVSVKTISYILIKNPDGKITGTVASRGALCYTGRVLLEKFSELDRVERLVSSGPIDIIGYFPEECLDIPNPSVIKKLDYYSARGVPEPFRRGPATFNSLDELKAITDKHNHFGVVNFFVLDNDQWYLSKHVLSKLSPLTSSVVDYDDEENG